MVIMLQYRDHAQSMEPMLGHNRRRQNRQKLHAWKLLRKCGRQGTILLESIAHCKETLTNVATSMSAMNEVSVAFESGEINTFIKR